MCDRDAEGVNPGTMASVLPGFSQSGLLFARPSADPWARLCDSSSKKSAATCWLVDFAPATNDDVLGT